MVHRTSIVALSAHKRGHNTGLQNKNHYRSLLWAFRVAVLKKKYLVNSPFKECSFILGQYCKMAKPVGRKQDFINVMLLCFENRVSLETTGKLMILS